jgi:hypothetical protein
MAAAGLGGEIGAAERALTVARDELDAARQLVVEIGGCGNDQEIEAALEKRDQAGWRVETCEARLEGLRARSAVLEAERRRAADLGLADRLAGWRGEFLRRSAACDLLMVQLAEALEVRAACLAEMAAVEPVGLRDVMRLGQPVAVVRGALAAGLGGHLPLAHPWQNRDHWGPLADPGGLGGG